ncbi:glutamine synthetase [Rhizobium leguminosarum]|uniref:Glutamine synthetase n=1 Tax=Rhizobium leguminosarum TaxID=384 RepID=A0A1L3Z4W3_RHILE|nr:glutamine synthetase translation inhibitor GstI [Rhizobium leguminosarum]API50699.1 glutamine synthetase [Rhizobium leguminosarum]
MPTGFHRESATIYQFPVKAIRNANRFERAKLMEREAADVCDAALDSCWYHDEAVRDSDRPTKS